ncbi:MAG: carbonic anhydrase [Campylobacteraceae bacterium]|nr:carbonic anhydrase [Campylobacteraceae bacterium]
MKNLKHFSTILLASMLSFSVAFAESNVTSSSALQELKDGNARFLAKKPINTDYEKQIAETKDGQKPHSAILTCMDSRVPPEIIFDQGIGNIFSLRNAGNIEDPNILGSLEYAVKFAGSKLIVVMGHTNCGAVTGAVENVESGNLSQLLDQIKPSIKDPLDDPKVVDKTAMNNVKKTINDILVTSPTIKEMVDKGEIEIIGAFYDLSTGKVDFFK